MSDKLAKIPSPTPPGHPGKEFDLPEAYRTLIKAYLRVHAPTLSGRSDFAQKEGIRHE